MPKAPTLTTIIIAAISALAWLYGYVTVSYGYYWRDFWFHVVVYFLPVGLIALGSWVAFHWKWWRKLVGGAILIPSFVIWALYLMLAANAFRIH